MQDSDADLVVKTKDPGCRILYVDPGFWRGRVLDLGSRSWILDPGSMKLYPGTGILDP